MRRLSGVLTFILFLPCAEAITVAPQAAAGDTTITLNPATPAPNERFTLTVRGMWSDGCVPQFQSVTGSGTTIQINAVANPNCISGCTAALTSYSLTTSMGTITSPGIYTVEYYVTECNKPRTLVKSQSIAISASCQFDRSLTVSPSAVRVGSSALLRWCDPSVNPTAEGGLRMNFFRVLAARSANGLFVPIGDIQGFLGVGINFDANDVGPAFFFIEAHECQVTMGMCTGDIVVRSNVVRVDVASATGCLQDGMTLCLNGGRFQVTANWRTADGNSGRGNAVSLTDDSGYFWFFGPNNVEVVVKALNACSQPEPRYWVFALGLTNVSVDLTVTDTKTGTVRTYSNPMGQPFQPIQDTGAFATCP
ncbi:MAG TPA: hypothetical protein VER58_21450 [Thermoanaerobaculia bacterium]|nr:hypothetical protein [Thermoanaerobaculia bacterium]